MRRVLAQIAGPRILEGDALPRGSAPAGNFPSPGEPHRARMATWSEPAPAPPQPDVWRAVVEQSPFSVVVYDAEGRLVFANATFREIWGVGPEEAPPGYSVLTDPELERQGILPVVRRAFAGEVVTTPPVRYDISRVASSGEGRSLWTQGHFYPLRDGAGRVSHVVLTHIDLSERMDVEAALRASEARFRATFDHAGIGMALVGNDGEVLEANAALLRLLGYAPGELLGNTVAGFTHPDDMATDMALFQELLAGERASYRVEKRYLRKDGGVVWGDLTVSLVRAPGGEPLYAVGMVEDVTERKRTERLLRESEQRFRLLFERNPLPMWIFDLETLRFLEVNDAAVAQYGYSRDEFLAMTIRDIRPPEVQAKLDAALRLPSGPGLVYRMAHRHRWKDGTVRDVEVTTTETVIEGRAARVALVLDVTERVRAEDALRESELRFRTLAESIPQLAWMAEPDGHIFWYNQRWYDYTGTTLEEMEGWGWQTVHDPEVLPDVVERWTRAIRSGERFEMEFPLRGADGRFRTFLTRVEPVRDGEGRVIRWFGTNTDVEELKLTQQELDGARAAAVARLAEAERARERLEVLAEVGAALAGSANVDDALRAMIRVAVPRLAAWCGVYVVDESGTVVRHDAAAADPERERFYRVLLERYPPDFRNPAHVVRRPLDTGEVSLSEIDVEAVARYARTPEHAELLRGLGLRATLAVPMTVEGRTVGVLALAHVEPGREFTPEDVALASEIARRAASAVERARLYDAALAASRAKTGFLATISHELRTPLNALLGYSDLLLLGIPEAIGPGAAAQVERIDRAARHLLSIIEEILTFSRIEAGRESVAAEPVDVGELAREVNAIVEPLAAQKRLRFVAPAPDGAVPLVTDPRKLRQILINLLGNAVKFTEKGEIAFEIEQEEVGAVAFRVRDTGMGISPEHLGKVFDPFWQADASQTRTAGGTGLGLTVSRELAVMLGGTLTARSTPGEGSEFVLRLPLRPAGEEPAAR